MISKILIQVSWTLFFSGISVAALADMPPHGRPANLITQPIFSVSLGGSLGNNSTQGHLALETLFTRRTQLVINATLDAAEVSNSALTNDVDTDGDGFGVGFYYQLPTTGGAFFTLAARYREDDADDDETITAGPGFAELFQERSTFDISVLGEQEDWATGGWQPYSAFGLRFTDTTVDITTSGGALISDSDSTEFSAQFTAGLHYQKQRFSWFVEGTGSTEDDNPWQLHTGVRFGFISPRS